MKILRIIIHLILFASIISSILPDDLSKICINLIIVCAISAIVINSAVGLDFAPYNFSTEKYIDEYTRYSKEFKENVNIYFNDIRKVTQNEKHNGDNY